MSSWQSIHSVHTSPPRLHTSPPAPIMRSNQIDAQRLDNELHALLMEQASAATAYAPEVRHHDEHHTTTHSNTQQWRHALQPELSATISLLV